MIVARDIMTAPARTVRPETSLREVRELLLRTGHGALPVVDGDARLVGILGRRDLEVALHHGFAGATVGEHMTGDVRAISPATSLDEIEELMVAEDIGRLPVVDAGGRVLGIVSRTDVLRAHVEARRPPDGIDLQHAFAHHFAPVTLARLTAAADLSEALGLRLYVVGGAVRDLLLGRASPDLDLVAEGGPAAAVRLGEALAARDASVRLNVYGRYQTAALTWPDGFAVDIATARTEFYARPAANPEVESAPIRLDLYRRDFTINAMAVALGGERAWRLIDPFGGRRDLAARLVRVLHPNSFIEDPTRIYRAVRFALRLGFRIAPQTEAFIRRTLRTGLHDGIGGERLKNELEYLLAAPYWLKGLAWLGWLDALRCLDPAIRCTAALRRALRRLDRAAAALPRLVTPPAQLRLERLLLEAPPPVVERIHLEGRSATRLAAVRAAEAAVHACLATRPSPGTLHRACGSQLSAEQILLLATWGATAAEGDRLLGYLARREALMPLVSGDDLKALGLRPGPHYREILESAAVAQLDGVFADRGTALTWLGAQVVTRQQQRE